MEATYNCSGFDRSRLVAKDFKTVIQPTACILEVGRGVVDVPRAALVLSLAVDHKADSALLKRFVA